jgi:hypothetical protein
MRAQGLILDWVLPFARAKSACGAAKRTKGRTVMVVEDAVNTGQYWVVSEADAQRLETMGYVRYVAKPEAPDEAEPE